MKISSSIQRKEGVPRRYFILSACIHILFIFFLILLEKDPSPPLEIVTVDLRSYLAEDKFQTKVGDRNMIIGRGGGKESSRENQKKMKFAEKKEEIIPNENKNDSKRYSEKKEETLNSNMAAVRKEISTFPVNEEEQFKEISAATVGQLGVFGTRTLQGLDELRGSNSGDGVGSGSGTTGLGSGPRVGLGRGQGNVSAEHYLAWNFHNIREIVMKNLRYPYIARLRGYEGEVVISFIINEKGQPEDIQVLSNSGHDLLAKNVVDVVKGIDKFPQPPVRLRVILPVTYKLK
ncbi:MAG: energy transducer TonB [Deltaproteobacteria bacterium]|nr:energy transducer TonB [Deltaproteobacteria bacterium]